jgi:hypothetical protein
MAPAGANPRRKCGFIAMQFVATMPRSEASEWIATCNEFGGIGADAYRDFQSRTAASVLL